MYYPKSQIKTDLYTNGGEFITSNDGVEYQGYYFFTSDGLYFTGRNPNNKPNFPLTLISNSSLSSLSEVNSLIFRADSYYDYPIGYNFALSSDIADDSIPPSLPTQTIVLPTEDEYKIGEFQRYFVSKNNEPYYIEVSQNEYNQYESREPNISWQLYTPFQLPWLLTGDRNEVFNVNRNTVKRISSNLKLIGFPSYFKGRYDQYYKDPT